MMIDGHSHVTLPVEESIEAMNRAGVDKTVLFSTLVHPELALSANELKQEMGKLGAILAGSIRSEAARLRALQELKEAVDRYPDRTLGFGYVPLGLSPEGTVRSFENHVIGNGFVGLGEYTLPSGAVPRLEPLFQTVSVIQPMPIWIHAFHPLVLSDLQDIAALAERYPSVPVIMGHLGGVHWLEALELVKRIPNLYLDTSAAYSTFVLKLVLRELPDKCIFGVDRPYGDLQQSLDTIRGCGVPAASLDQVLGGTLQRLLKLS
ncbi:amidohydrolase family protein [Gorillibacterium sp. sgz500922]|uniref:amidohydrolase family protein n=1 Tax=Gorillibacterium sp. sgz500922 TaxID=3446694 RepID=UPI003F676066